MVTGSSAPRSGSHRAKLGWIAMAVMAVASAAQAQAPRPVPPMSTPAASPVFAIKGFKVTGENPLGDGETARVLAPFLRTDANIDTLQKATAALETALKDKGYGLHRVSLPPQEVGDTVTLNIVKFTIGKVNVEGRSIYDEANIRRTVPELREGHTPNFKTLAVQTAIANENPNKLVQVGLREGDQPDRIEATITVKEDKPWTIAASISNAGTASSGRDRFTLSGAHSNLWNLDHQFVGAYTTSLQRTSDVKQLGLSYKAPLYNEGLVVGASYTRSDVLGDFGTFTSTGAGHTFGVSVTKYLAPEGGRRSYISAGFDDKVFDRTLISGVPVGVDRRSRPVWVGYNVRTESDTSVWGFDVSLAANTGSGRANDLVSYRQENNRIDTINWKALRGGVNYSAPFATNWLWSARANFQLSPDVLISGEQFGLGGLGSVRGTAADRPISGDFGIQSTFELTTPELVPGLRVHGFVDAGWLGNNSSDNPARPNPADKPSSDSIASVGLGLRYSTGPFGLSMDYGRLVAGSKVPLTANAGAPRRGDDRFYVNLSVKF